MKEKQTIKQQSNPATSRSITALTEEQLQQVRGGHSLQPYPDLPPVWRNFAPIPEGLPSPE